MSINQKSITCVFKDLSIIRFRILKIYVHTLNGLDGVDPHITKNMEIQKLSSVFIRFVLPINVLRVTVLQ